MNYPAIDDEAANIFDRPNMTGTPERRLLLAILERALLDYVGNDQKEYEEVMDWIFESLALETAMDFSFPWICDQLDLDVADIRSKIKQMPRRGASRIAPWYLTKGYSTKSDKNVENELVEKKSAKVIKFSNKPKKAIVY